MLKIENTIKQFDRVHNRWQYNENDNYSSFIKTSIANAISNSIFCLPGNDS